MKLLQDRVLRDGVAVSDTILKVDSFLNHQMDPTLMQAIGKEFAHHFANHQVTKVFTIESSGIAPAIMTAHYLKLQLVTLKKQTSKTLKQDLYQTDVHSFTKGLNYRLTLAKQYLSPADNILIIDDFLANGEAALGAARLVEMAGARVAGVGIVIEKAFQPGRQRLLAQGYEVYSLARIASLTDSRITFT